MSDSKREKAPGPDGAFAGAAIELELKYDLVNAERYQRLLTALAERCDTIILTEQENYFYDSAEKDLTAQNIALRVRVERRENEPVSASVTLKGETEQSDELAHRPEIEAAISESEAIAITAGGIGLLELANKPLASAAKLLGAKKLLPLISFTNRRTTAQRCSQDKSLKFEVDQTLFADGSSDFELEIESTNATVLQRARETVAELFAQLEIPLIAQTRSKLQRALARTEASK